jgi:hypothetical protein
MRVLKFDQQTIEALRALGFKIADDNEAEINTHVTIGIIRPADMQMEFCLVLTLPTGPLACFTHRQKLLDAASEAIELGLAGTNIEEETEA